MNKNSSFDLSNVIRRYHGAGVFCFKSALLFFLLVVAFAAYAQPVISSLSAYIAAPGSALTISGSGFNTTAANNKVYFGATKATVSSATSSSIVVTVPAGATFAPVSVTNSTTGLTGYSGRFFLPTFTPGVYIPGLYFGNRSFVDAPYEPTSIAIGDIDGDGKSDLLVTYTGLGLSVSIFRNISATGTLTDGSFAAPITIHGIEGTHLAISDLDADGKPEIIVGGTQISVLKNNCTPGTIASGSFSSAVVLATSAVHALKIADLDGDGKPDIVASDGFGFSLIKNNVTGASISASSFASPVAFATGTVTAITIGDVDGDNKPDVVTAYFYAVSVFRNISSPGAITTSSLAPQVDFLTTTSATISDVMICDIDGNGKPELITSNLNQNKISVFKNTSTTGSITGSSFAAHIDFTTGVRPVSIASGDMDGDGKPDIVVSNEGTFITGGAPQTAGNISVLRNTSTAGTISTASFAPKSDYNVYLVNGNVVVGDLDGDGRPDIVTFVKTFHAWYAALLQNFLPPPSINTLSPTVGTPGTTVTIGGTNFNTTPDSNVVYFGATRAIVSTASHTSLSVTVPGGADYGQVTVKNSALGLAGYSSSAFLPTYDNSMYLPGQFNFDPKVDLAATTGARFTALGDIDGDGKADLIVASNASFSVYRNISISGTLSSSSFASPVTFSTSAITKRLLVRDMDGDGKLDIIIAATNDFYIFRNIMSSAGVISSSSFAAGVHYTFGRMLDIDDVDKDGKPDILLAGPTGVTNSIIVSRNVTVPETIDTHSFDISALITSGSIISVDNLFLKDMDGDGKPDIVSRPTSDYINIQWSHATNGSVIYPLDINDASADSLFTFSDNIYISTGSATLSNTIAIGDIDGDGKPDIVTADTNGVGVFRNLSTGGVGAFASKVHIHTGYSPKDIKLEDIDGDGKPDLVLLNYVGNSLTVLRNVASGGITASSFTASGVNFPTLAGPLALTTGDIDGDGKPDLLVANSSSFISLFRNSPLAIDSMAITGALVICGGSTTALSVLAPGGTWTSSNISVASIGSGTGIVSGTGVGTTIISYIVPGDFATAVVTVNPLPNAGSITAVDVMCATGAVTCISSGAIGGAWSSSNSAVATVNAASGNVSGISGGTVMISYTVTNGCGVNIASHTMTVLPLPVGGTISGTLSLCTGASTSLATSGTGGGTWSSSNISVGTVSAIGVVSAIAAGTTTISYTITNSCGTATATQVVTVTGTASAGTITGPSSVNTGAAITLSNSITGGTWTAGNSHATVSSLGVVTGVTAGTVIVSYTVTNTCGTAIATTIITVNTSLSGITGSLGVCVGSGTLLSSATPGGSWSSSASVAVMTLNPSTGLVTGVAAGTGMVTYTLSGSSVIAMVTVNPLPAAISGASAVCLGATTALAETTSGGTWSSASPAVASVNAGTGIVTGNTTGSTTITYIMGTGCLRSFSMIVKPLPAAITGPASLCIGSTAVYTDATSGGMSWTSSNLAVGTIGASSGILNGISAGTTIITYTLITGCAATRVVSINALPAPIGGTPGVCVGSATALTDADGGGTWSSGNTLVATVGSATGIVTGLAAGATYIVYSTGAGCNRTASLTVNPSPAVITGGTTLCAGTTTALACATTGGTWSSGATGIATVTAGGIVTGLTPGMSTISYAMGTGCTRTTTVTVSGTLTANTGTSVICVGSTTLFGNSTPGGAWTSSNTAIASVTPSGIVTGNGAGIANITYALSATCRTITTITVNASIPAITGVASVCVNATTSLADAVPGGAWSSGSPSLGTVSTSGVVTGIAAGTITISYTLTGGCYRTTNVVVKPLPGPITGNTGLCVGATSTVTDGTGLSWVSSMPSVATIGVVSGVITGIAPGTATITFNAITGCIATRIVTVGAAPSIATISGPGNVAIGHTIVLADATPGGVWSSSNPAMATVSSTGVVTGIAGPASIIGYTITSGVCVASVTKLVTVTASRYLFDPVGISGVALCSVFPNPTTGSCSVRASVDGMLTICTITGKELLHKDISEGLNMFELPGNLAAGVYFCSFYGVDGNNVTLQLVYRP